MNLKPTAGYALIEPVEMAKQTQTGIILPDTHDEKSQRGIIKALGSAPLNDKGLKIPVDFKVKDEVIYKKWGGEEIKLDLLGKEMVFVKFEDILAIVSK